MGKSWTSLLQCNKYCHKRSAVRQQAMRIKKDNELTTKHSFGNDGELYLIPDFLLKNDAYILFLKMPSER